MAELIQFMEELEDDLGLKIEQEFGSKKAV